MTVHVKRRLLRLAFPAGVNSGQLRPTWYEPRQRRSGEVKGRWVWWLLRRQGGSMRWTRIREKYDLRSKRAMHGVHGRFLLDFELVAWDAVQHGEPDDVVFGLLQNPLIYCVEEYADPTYPAPPYSPRTPPIPECW